MQLDKSTQAVADLYSKMVKEKQEAAAKEIVLNEAVNDHEALHAKIISKFHKHYPEMNLDKAEHKEKYSGRGEETHVYHAEMPIHSSVKNLFHTLHSKVSITHSNGKVYSRLSYAYTHPGGGHNGHDVASIGEHEGHLHIRDTASGVFKKA